MIRLTTTTCPAHIKEMTSLMRFAENPPDAMCAMKELTALSNGTPTKVSNSSKSVSARVWSVDSLTCAETIVSSARPPDPSSALTRAARSLSLIMRSTEADSKHATPSSPSTMNVLPNDRVGLRGRLKPQLSGEPAAGLGSGEVSVQPRPKEAPVGSMLLLQLLLEGDAIRLSFEDDDGLAR
eukprot:scaffold127591_cov63-Phaeocystis_antarctica.AAC.1